MNALFAECIILQTECVVGDEVDHAGVVTFDAAPQQHITLAGACLPSLHYSSCCIGTVVSLDLRTLGFHSLRLILTLVSLVSF